MGSSLESIKWQRPLSETSSATQPFHSISTMFFQVTTLLICAGISLAQLGVPTPPGGAKNATASRGRVGAPMPADRNKNATASRGGATTTAWDQTLIYACSDAPWTGHCVLFWGENKTSGCRDTAGDGLGDNISSLGIEPGIQFCNFYE
jgi:hypothetical protein